MGREFMRKKFNFFTQGCAILFTPTTILVSPYQALKFFNLNKSPIVQF
jgi:hypothetical protein